MLFAASAMCQGCESAPGAEADGVAPPAPAVVAPAAPRFGAFAPTFRTAAADAYPEACEIYDSSPRASQGVYRHSGLLFVVVVIDNNREHLRYLEGTAMLRSAALLREAFPSLPPRFRARNRLVEKTFDEDTGIYRYAQAFRESDIKRLAENASATR